MFVPFPVAHFSSIVMVNISNLHTLDEADAAERLTAFLRVLREFAPDSSNHAVDGLVVQCDFNVSLT